MIARWQHSVVFFVCLFVCLQSCQADLVKDNGHKYFLSVLADAYMRVSQIQLWALLLDLACQHQQFWLGDKNYYSITCDVFFFFFRLSSVQWQHLCYQSLWMNIQLVKWVQKFTVILKALFNEWAYSRNHNDLWNHRESLMHWLLATFCW